MSLPMTERQLTPLRCLENLFNSDCSPEDIRDPERMALAVLDSWSIPASRSCRRTTRRTSSEPECPVVWEGRRRETSPYPDQSPTIQSDGLTL